VAAGRVAFPAFAGPYAGTANQLLWWPFSVAYYVIGNGLGGTFGKRWLGLRVVDATGAVPGMRRTVIRAILPYGLSLVTILIGDLADVDAGLVGALTLLVLLTWLLDDLWMIWDPQTDAARQTGGYLCGPGHVAISGNATTPVVVEGPITDRDHLSGAISAVMLIADLLIVGTVEVTGDVPACIGLHPARMSMVPAPTGCCEEALQVLAGHAIQ